jgi:hypothetical protein
VAGTNLDNRTACTIVGRGSGLCSNGACEECIAPADCGPPATECRAAFTCVGNSCGGGGVINNNGRCDPAGAATVGICQNGTCNAVGCVTPNDCNGGPASECRAATTCTANVCGGGGVIDNVRCDPPGAGTVGICLAGTCNPVGCITPEDCGRPAAGECRAATTCTGNVCGGGGIINNNGRCDPPGASTIGLCQDGTCNAVQCINPEDCGGPPASECRAATMCLSNLCSGGGVINNNGRCDPPGEATTGVCRAGTCSAVGCIDAIDCDDRLPCTNDACSQQGSCSNTPAAAGTACGAGNQCDGDGQCVALCGNGRVDPGEVCDLSVPLEQCLLPGIGSRVCSADCLTIDDTCLIGASQNAR